MHANPTPEISPADPASVEYDRFRKACRKYWRTHHPADRMNAEAALARFRAAFVGTHGDRAVIPFPGRQRHD